MLIEVNKNVNTGKYEVETNATSGGANLESNKTATIDVSTYTEPVEITPTEGKDGMEKATVTLSNIPSGGVSTLYAWKITNDEYIYFSTSPTVKAGDYLLTMSISGISADIEIASYDESTQIATDTYNSTYERYPSYDYNFF